MTTLWYVDFKKRQKQIEGKKGKKKLKYLQPEKNAAKSQVVPSSPPVAAAAPSLTISAPSTATATSPAPSPTSAPSAPDLSTASGSEPANKYHLRISF